jgi:hypothetical protein
MRKAGFLATIAAGFGLLGASLHGLTSVDRTLEVAAAKHQPGVVGDCPKPRDTPGV